MRRLIALAGLLVAAASLSACAVSGSSGGGTGARYDPGPPVWHLGAPWDGVFIDAG